MKREMAACYLAEPERSKKQDNEKNNHAGNERKPQTADGRGVSRKRLFQYHQSKNINSSTARKAGRQKADSKERK